MGSVRVLPAGREGWFWAEWVWRLARGGLRGAQLTCIAGPEFALHWARFAGQLRPPDIPGVRLLGFVEDVRPAYADTNVVVVPTTVSAGTNVKVLEAMAMGRAGVSPSSGCAGLELAVSCDFRLAAHHSTFALPEIRLGLVPSSGGVSRLTLLVGTGWARWLAIAGRVISAYPALSIGLAQSVSPP